MKCEYFSGGNAECLICPLPNPPTHSLSFSFLPFKSSTIGQALKLFIVLADFFPENNSVESTAALMSIFQLMHLPGQGYLIPRRPTCLHSASSSTRMYGGIQNLAHKMGTEDLRLTERETAREGDLDNVVKDHERES